MTARRFAAGVALVLVGFALGLGAGSDRPDCPAEDSCTIDYRHGTWHVEEVTP